MPPITWTPSPTRPTFASYPYENGHHGYVRRELREVTRPIGRDASGFAMVEGFYLGDRVYGPGLSLGVDYRRIGVESNLDWLVEGVLEDAMYLGSTNARLGLVMNPYVRLYSGLGVQYMVDGRLPGDGVRDYALGPNFALGLEMFPADPFVLSGRLDMGSLYRAPSAKLRLEAGVALHGVGLYGGYQVRNIAGVVLHGPTVGMRLWL